ncbi:MAG: glycerol-3-phosphate dehydrogenase [Alphaproteobacteria bacterium]|nr:glycerol-3-phosphate dehydrogenase [Alphaproteobacteria bacterium]
MPAGQPRDDRDRRQPGQGDVAGSRAGDDRPAVLPHAADRRPRAAVGRGDRGDAQGLLHLRAAGPRRGRVSDLGTFDLLVVGGGVNGAGIARDAAGRGLSVLLCEKGDLGEGTSSRSGKLVHGGLRYLEHYEFRLVREALIEREVLLAAAPHIVWPLRFVLPHSPGHRPAWLVRLGLFLYDHLGGRERLPGTRTLDLRAAPEGRSIVARYRRAFEYSDCWVDDARLVVLNALDAAERGARIMTRTECRAARREGGLWRVALADRRSGAVTAAAARILVNAAGPWVTDVLSRVAGASARRALRLVKGSHIVVQKFWEGPQAYLLQNDDRRVIFVNPYEDDLCLIGTTDIPYEGPPEAVAIDAAEVDYLIAVVNRYFVPKLDRGDIVHAFSGVRPLYDDAADDPSAVTRDYVFDVDAGEGSTPLLSVFGGKITTFRKLAEHALAMLSPHLPAAGPAWTAAAPLPGGDMPGGDFDAFHARFAAARPWLPPALARHYARLYGTRAESVLDGARSLGDLGRHFGGRLYEREVRHLVAREWARTAEDVLDRRTKHGLHLTRGQRDAFAAWLAGAA